MEEEVKENDRIAEANAAAERLEKANKEHAELLKRQEFLESRRIIGGQSVAGQTAPEMTQDEKINIELKQKFKGTAMERYL